MCCPDGYRHVSGDAAQSATRSVVVVSGVGTTGRLVVKLVSPLPIDDGRRWTAIVGLAGGWTGECRSLDRSGNVVGKPNLKWDK